MYIADISKTAGTILPNVLQAGHSLVLALDLDWVMPSDRHAARGLPSGVLGAVISVENDPSREVPAAAAGRDGGLVGYVVRLDVTVR